MIHLIAGWLGDALRAAQADGGLPAVELDAVPVERARRRAHGDFASSVALQLAQSTGLPPRKIAQAIIDHLPPRDFAARVAIAGAGFINITLAEPWLAAQVDAIARERAAWGRPDLGRGRRALVEFVSANPTGPLHVGRTWGAVLGDTLARLLEHAGYQVSREYYFNNTGKQVRVLGESVRARYRQLLGQAAEFPGDGYQGEYVVEMARAIQAEVGSAWADADAALFADRAQTWLLEDIRRTLQRLEVRFDVWFSEQGLETGGGVERTLQTLRASGYAYDAEGAVWLRAAALGAPKDRVLVRSDGEPTYRLRDIAYHADKLGRGLDLCVDVLGADHAAEWPDVVSAVRAMGLPAENLRLLLHQFINLVQAGQPVRMSTRRANYVTLDDLLDAVTLTHPESGVTLPGKDAVRFMLLTRGPGSPMNFDLALVRQQSNDNPVYYVQYAHARMASLLRKAAELGWAEWLAAPAAPLAHPAELDLVRRMLELPEVVERAVNELAPHHLAAYAYALAETFHTFYHDCPVLPAQGRPDPAAAALTRARLKLVDAARVVLARVLGLMGVSAPERM